MSVKLKLVSQLDDKGINKAKRGLFGLQQSASGVAKKIAGFFAGAYLFASLIRGAKASVKAFLVQEDAVKSLRAALALGGSDADALSSKYENLASSLQKLSRFGDEEILKTIALGRNMGILEKDLERASVAAVGLAAKFGVDLRTSMQLVAKAAAGDTGTLKRYGIVLTENATATEKYNELLRLGAEGMAVSAAETETAQGQINQLRKSFGDLSEKIGEAVLAGTPLLSVMETMLLYVEDLIATDASGWADGLAASFEAVMKVVGPVRDAIQWLGAFIGAKASGVGFEQAADIAGEVVSDIKQERADRRERVQAKIVDRKRAAQEVVDNVVDTPGEATASSAAASAAKTATAKSLAVSDLFDIARGQFGASNPGESPSNPIYTEVVNADEVGGITGD